MIWTWYYAQPTKNDKIGLAKMFVLFVENANLEGIRNDNF